MSQKRDIYRDPDYSQFQPAQTQSECDKKKSSEIKSDTKVKNTETRIEAIRRIIDREFNKELTSKEEELEEINKRLDETKKLLAKVRYAVVYNYYNQKHLLPTAEDIAAVEKSEQECMTSYPSTGDKPQMAIHPSLKKLLGKRPIDYNEILKTRPTRKAAQNATEQFQKLAKKSTDNKSKMHETIANEVIDECRETKSKKPRYVAPSSSNTTIPQVNSARGRNTYRHVLVVGNVSKYIGDEEVELGTNVTHKWLVYISTKSAVPVENIVCRARFFLHESYKPNDIIEVSSPPFRISKRGWGEFPVRVQLYFHPHLMQKPLQIFHKLILDKKHTGLQTMGAETIVEVWLNMSNTVKEEEKLSTSNETKQSTTTNSKSPMKLASTNSIEPSKSSTNNAVHYQQLPQSEPCTSAQVMSRTYENMQHSIVKSEAIVKQEVKLEPIQTKWQNGINPPQLTPIKIKTEQPIPPVVPTLPITSVMPQLRICDQNNINSVNPSSPSSKGNAKKTFMKCVGKDGEVSLMELVQDEKNPKLFKMLLPPGLQANKIIVKNFNRTGGDLSTNVVKQITPVSKIATTVARPLIRTVSPSINSAYIAINSSASKLSAGLVNSPNQSGNRQVLVENDTNTLKTTPTPFSMPKLVAINSPHPSTSAMNRPIPPPKITVVSSQGLTFVPSPRVTFSPSPGVMSFSPQGIKSLPSQIVNCVPSSEILSVPLSKQSNLIQKPLTSIHRKNKVLVLDSNRMSKAQQQSLLKPQVSLLKPRSTPINANLKKITVSNITGLENKNINVFVPADIKLESITRSQAAQVRRRYGKEMELRFLARKSFSNLTEAIGWLLKEIPLISSIAEQSEFRESFPFVVPSLTDFHRLLIAKQRSFEWLRAKYINRLIQKHDSLKDYQKWNTKEIVLFGRWFGYTPHSVFHLQKSEIKTEKEQNVHDIVKSELIREHLQMDTISFNKKLIKWIENVEENIKCLIFDENIIVVDDDVNEEQVKTHKSPSTMKRNCIKFDIEHGYDEVMWINEVCRKMQIRFDQEEIVEGVLHRSAEQVFATALRSFVEDLLRKCCGSKQRTTNIQSSSTEINNDDILHTISSIQHFDFLTNKNLGIEKPNPT